MPLKGRVGRHTKQQGRHCQNWPEDQILVVGLLNRIAESEGGAGGGLTPRIVNGMASDELYSAISRFENQHFPGQGSGYVDPGGAMLKRMEELAMPPPSSRGRFNRDPWDAVPLPQPWTLDYIYRELLNHLPSNIREPLEKGGHLHAEGGDALIVMAVRHVKSLQERKFTRLPWPVVMWGRAYIYKSFKMLPYAESDGSVSFMNVDTHDRVEPNLPHMRYGEPIEATSNSVITGKLHAFLLYTGGMFRLIPPYHEFIIAQAALPVPGYDRPLPITGADKHGVK
jgi:hypothetical protein